MAIFATKAAGPGEAVGPMYQAEAELGAAPGKVAVQPPPGSNGAGNSADKAAAVKGHEADAPDLTIDDAVQTGVAAAGADAAAEAAECFGVWHWSDPSPIIGLKTRESLSE